MTWTIARSPAAGNVLLPESEAALSAFHEVTFARVDQPGTLSEEAIAERLRGARGFFQLNGEVPRELHAAFTDGKPLVLTFETRGWRVRLGVTRHGEIARVLLHESGIIGTQFPFEVTGAITVAAAPPSDV